MNGVTDFRKASLQLAERRSIVFEHLIAVCIESRKRLKATVEQLRGVAINQVQDAEFALVTGGPASLPVSGMILRRA